MKTLTVQRLVGAGVLALMIPVLVRDVRAEDHDSLGVRHSLSRTVWDSVYSANQAGRGETAYLKSCARCHKATLSGADEASPLAGSGFVGNWNGVPLSDLADRIRKTMPSDSVGIFDRQLVSDVMAYMLKVNGFPAGANDLPKDLDGLKDITIQATKP